MDDPAELVATADCLCLASRRAARAITRKFDAALRPSGLRATQFTLLASLALKGPQPIGALAAFIGVERTTLTRNLALIEAQGLVALRPGSDARAHVAAITAAGRRKLNRAFGAWREMQSQLTSSMGQPAADGLRRIARAPAIRNLTKETSP